MGLPITVEPAPGKWRVTAGDTVLGETASALVLKEDGCPDRLYVPRADLDMSRLASMSQRTTCPWKGDASYFALPGLGGVAWSYEEPFDRVAAIAGHLSFLPAVRVEMV